MFFAINQNGYSGFGETLIKAYKDLKDQDSDCDVLNVEFYKGEKIVVELRKVDPVQKPAPIKKAK